jgi:RNA polymerase sigma-70 factor (ECF subfamily)
MSTPLVTAALAELLTIADGDPRPLSSREEPHLGALLDAARAGNREAFGDLVTLFQRVVFRTALAALGTREDAEDATQEAFVVAWRKLSDFRGDSTFRTWLLTIAWRKALDRRRIRKLWWNRTQPARPVTEIDPVDELKEGAADPERQAVSRDMARRVRHEIGRLSPKLRDTLLLAATGEHSYEEIAGMLGIPVGTVKWRVSAARKTIEGSIKKGPGHDRF